MKTPDTHDTDGSRTAEIVLQVDGLALQRSSDDGEFRIRDLDLATQLGYDRPRDIRRLIRGLVATGELSGLSTRAVPALGKMRGNIRETILVEEYWLDHLEAILVVGGLQLSLVKS